MRENHARHHDDRRARGRVNDDASGVVPLAGQAHGILYTAHGRLGASGGGINSLG